MGEFQGLKRVALDILGVSPVGASIQYRQYPTSGTGTGGVSIAAGNAQWGTSTALLAASTITTDFWLCGAGEWTDSASGNGNVFNVEIIGAAATAVTPIVMEFTIQFTAATINLPPLMLVYPVYFPANSALAARTGAVAANNGVTINLYFIYATGL